MHRYIKVFLLCALFALAVAEIDDEVKNIQDTVEDTLSKFNTSGLPNMDEAEEVFKKKCIKEANEAAYDKALIAKEDFIKCLQNLVNFEKLKDEIEEARPTGDLDVVFKKYCNKSSTLKQCVANVTNAVEPCLNEKERANKKIFLNITESLTDFICWKEGDRIALFIAEGGPECLMDKQEAIEGCVNSSLSKYIPKDSLSLDNLPDLLIKAEQCDDMTKLQTCIVAELETCQEPTPANIAESLFKFVRQVTPCGKKGNTAARGATPPPGSHNSTNSAASVVISSLVLMVSAVYFV